MREHFRTILLSLQSRGLIKQSNLINKLFPKKKIELITPCPICGNQPEPECVLCDGSGALISIVADDDEDERIKDELKIE